MYTAISKPHGKAHPKITIGTCKIEQKSNPNKILTKYGHQTTREENKRRRVEKRPTQINFKTIKKMAIGTYTSVITLNVNGLSAPTKRHKVTEWIQKTTTVYVFSTRDTLHVVVHTG